MFWVAFLFVPYTWLSCVYHEVSPCFKPTQGCLIHSRSLLVPSLVSHSPFWTVAYLLCTGVTVLPVGSFSAHASKGLGSLFSAFLPSSFIHSYSVYSSSFLRKDRVGCSFPMTLKAWKSHFSSGFKNLFLHCPVFDDSYSERWRQASEMAVPARWPEVSPQDLIKVARESGPAELSSDLHMSVFLCMHMSTQ